MATANMVVQHVTSANGRAVLVLTPVTGAAGMGEAHGTATINVPLEQDKAGNDIPYDDVAEGDVVTVSVVKAKKLEGASAAHAEGRRRIAAAKAIPNATNDPNYVTPDWQKAPPPVLPDGVVTEPRPSVVIEPLSDTPPTAGVATAAPTVK